MEPTPSDTSPAAQALLDAKWRALSPSDKARIVEALWYDTTALALAGIKRQHGLDADDDETPFYLAARRYGMDLARKAYEQ